MIGNGSTRPPGPDVAMELGVLSQVGPSRPVLEHITGRWGSLILAVLGSGPVRFNELRRRVDGVSPKILAQTLQSLERDGFVHRELQSTFPLRVEYSLTPLGHEITVTLLALIEQLEARMPDVLAAQNRHDGKAETC